MTKTFQRNFLILILIVISCAAGLSYSLIKGEQDLRETDITVLSIHDVIIEAQQLSTLIEGMVSSQRGYIITEKEPFLEAYNQKKASVSERIAKLTELTENNLSQQSRLDEIRQNFVNFSSLLEDRVQRTETEPASKILGDADTVNSAKDYILSINSEVIAEEYRQLNQWGLAVSNKKNQYFKSLLISVFVGTALILLFNIFLMRAHYRRGEAEISLKDTEKRYALAVDATKDGIIDWDVKNDAVFFSQQFFNMLDYETQKHEGDIEEFKKLVHPDDLSELWCHVERYLDGEEKEFHQAYRIKDSAGRWLWIDAKAKGLFDSNGQAMRMVISNTDITNRIKSRERLQQEKKTAEQANKAKSDFLAHMSHEIRTPLTAIRGISEILNRKSEKFDEKERKLIRTLNSSTSSLKDLITDILDFSKIESGEIEINRDNFDLRSLFEEVISMMSLKASEKNLDFTLDYNNAPDMAFYGDRTRIRQILVNLIGNAIKFTDKGYVKVTVNKQASSENRLIQGTPEGVLSVAIEDSGSGIKESDFETVFDRFKQGDSSVSRKYGGTGLGLPISRNLARLMGGEIVLKSKLGSGSAFTLMLPILELTTTQESPPQEVELTDTLDNEISKLANDKHRILIVEDYEGNITFITYILDDLGLNYDIAKTGKEALSEWAAGKYTAILMDIQMPDMDGFSATKAIREREKDSKEASTTIIGMTAHALMGDEDKCIEAGMDHYLPKPIDELELKKLILKRLSTTQKRDAA